MTPPGDAVPPTGRRVLIVEDDADSRDLYKVFLEFHGFLVDTAADATEAIQRARALPPDVILMDVSLPEMDGWAAVRKLKALPETAAVPVIMNTAHAGPGERADGVRYEGFLSKPCEPQDMLNEIVRVTSPGAPSTERVQS